MVSPTAFFFFYYYYFGSNVHTSENPLLASDRASCGAAHADGLRVAVHGATLSKNGNFFQNSAFHAQNLHTFRYIQLRKVHYYPI